MVSDQELGWGVFLSKGKHDQIFVLVRTLQCAGDEKAKVKSSGDGSKGVYESFDQMVVLDAEEVMSPVVWGTRFGIIKRIQ